MILDCDPVHMGPCGLAIPNIVRSRQDYFRSIQKQMKRDSRFSNRNLFFRDLTEGLRGVNTNTGTPSPLKKAPIRRATKTQGGGGLNEAGLISDVFGGNP